jgi:LmeA-like phospholipid-binding
MRGSVAALIVAALLLFAADQGARYYEQAQVAHSIKKSLGLQTDPDVALGGFPFLAEMAQGQIPSAAISVAGLQEGGLKFSGVHLVLLKLKFSLSQFLNARLHSIRAASGIGRASISVRSVNAFLRAHRVPFTLSFKNGQAITQLGSLSAAIDVGIKVSDGSLQISAGPLPKVYVPLPHVLPGLVYGSARPGDGSLIFNFRLRRPTLDLRAT